jgi:hypothetical protein
VSFYESDIFCSSFKHRLIFFAKHIKFITVCIFGFKIKVKVEKKKPAGDDAGWKIPDEAL